VTDLLGAAAAVADDRPGAPHGGRLVDLVAGPERAAELAGLSVTWPSWTLSRRQLCDLELLATGGFSPLRGFLGKHDYDSVCESMRLAGGTLWPVPVTLDLPEDVLRAAEAAGALALRDPEGVMVAALQPREAWRPDLAAEAEAVLGTTDPAHPGVEHLLRRTNPWYVAGALEVVRLPEHPDFRSLRHTPAQLRAEFRRRGWTRVVAFQTRNPMHRAHQELTLRAARAAGAKLLIHPVVGITKPGDVDPYVRVRCYRALLPTYPEGSAMVSLLPLAMRMAGPREALWHAIIRKNHGATHFVVGRDHAGPGTDSRGHPFYGPYEAQELLRRHEAELGVQILPFPKMVCVDEGRYVPEAEVPAGARVLTLSGTDLRRRLAAGEELPPWFTPPEVAAELRRSFPPLARQGFTVFFTGLPGAGKSTLARMLDSALRERGGRHVTLLDGDLVRRHMSKELGFSREHRDLNVRRIGFVAAEVTRSGGAAICAPIAPYDATRRDVRRMVGLGGGFVLVHVATPLPVCEERDPKGLYAKARLGLLRGLTGVSDPYEEPTDADLVIDTGVESAQHATRRILDHLRDLGYLTD
jgi:sulfate adenylyltransferase